MFSKSNRLHVVIFRFFFINVTYIPIESSKIIGKSPEAWNFSRLIISQTHQPVRLYLAAGSPHSLIVVYNPQKIGAHCRISPPANAANIGQEVERDICLQRTLDSTFSNISFPQNYSYVFFGSTSGAWRAFPGRVSPLISLPSLNFS